MDKQTFLTSIEQSFNGIPNDKFNSLKYPWQVSNPSQRNTVYRDGLSFAVGRLNVSVTGIYGDQDLEVTEYLSQGQYKPLAFEALPIDTKTQLLCTAQSVVNSI